MTYLKLTTAALLALSVSACSSLDTATRNAPLDVPALGGEQQLIQRSYNVQNVQFSVPEELEVSESNGYYPMADIVWRGDVIGDRKEQIGALFGEAMSRNAPEFNGNIPVQVDMELVRFHGVTERTRFSVGGVYNIVFNMTVRNAVTGEVIEPTRRIKADLSAPGGVAAILAEQRGQTEKVRVTDFLTQVLNDELTGQFTL